MLGLHARLHARMHARTQWAPETPQVMEPPGVLAYPGMESWHGSHSMESWHGVLPVLNRSQHCFYDFI